MRPVRLRMDSFAAFREACVVDFADADYFVLVGPTGAGKSTVIDALTFALYGSVPRWNDERTVALALAPTAGRGTVSLVFDAGGERYVAVRELRRNASTGAVTVREARLERLADPSGTGEPGEETVPVADGAKVTPAVTELLGLQFKDFCTSVVLPQGEFAEFLHAKPTVRQEKLERILGLGVYDLIMKRANTEARDAGERARVLDEQLVRFADATADAERAAASRLAALRALGTRVDERVLSVRAASAELERARADGDRLRAETGLLSALDAPAGLDQLDARLQDAATAVQRARAGAEAADRADTDARAYRDAAPDRAVLDRVHRAHVELAGLDAELPGLRTRHETARSAYRQASAAATRSRADLDRARDRRDRAAAALVAAEDEVATLTGHRDALAEPALPDGLDDLARRRDAAVARRADADRAYTAAEAAEDDARTELGGAPPREPLESARRDHTALAEARAGDADARDRQTDAERAERDAADRLAAARTRRDDARERLHAAERSDHAAALRPSLADGEACPVCAQTVHTLPGRLPDDAATAARAAAERAEREHDAARDRHTTAAGARTAAAAESERTAAAVTRLEKAVAEYPDASAVDDALTRLDRLAGAVEEASAAARTARRERDRAAQRSEDVGREVDAVGAGLRSARTPLVALGAGPHGTAIPPEDGDPVAGWRALLAWTAEGERAVAAALATAAGAAAAAARLRDTARDELTAADRAAERQREVETAAARDEQDAGAALARAEARHAEVRAELDGAPPPDTVAAELVRVAELERRARDADAAARKARDVLRAAERDRAAVDAEVAAARDELRRLRDPLVALDAPALSGDTLAGAWSAFSAWAAERVAERRDRLAAATDAATAARTTRDRLVAELRADLAAHDLDPRDVDAAVAANVDAAAAAAEALAGTAQRDVVAAVQDARFVRERVAERRAEAAELVDARDRAEEASQVANVLGNELRSNRFPQWLVASALDALVVDGSSRLDELSDGQFALTHDRGEFLVVDHADADARRPVRTLSGGETFQASLALALALSDQLAGLAAHGAPRLESIFLDEGFGTLDEANLETVAATLENLAAGGGRMVGVITHVSALAERIPVRFAVRRDQRTSSIVREGGPGPDGGATT